MTNEESLFLQKRFELCIRCCGVLINWNVAFNILKMLEIFEKVLENFNGWQADQEIFD